jgi:zinc protease
LPQKEFDELLRQNLAATEKQISEPDALAQNTLDRIMNPYPKTDARYVMTIQEQIDALKAVKLDDVKRFYTEFYGGTNAGVGIVGDFDTEAASKIIASGIGAWKSPIKYQRIPNTFVDVKAKNEAIQTPDKANALFLAGLNLPIQDTDADFASLYVGNFVLGGGALSSRLADRIRQKEGISYGVGSFMSAEADDKSGNWGAYAIYAPENAERLEKAFQEEIEKILKEGITEKELEDVKKSIMQSRNVNRADDNRLVGKLGYYAVQNRKFDWDKNFEAQINKLTVDDVNKVLRKHIVPSKITIVKAGDFEKAKKIKP